MIRRFFWLLLGLGLGVGITLRAQRAVKASIERYVPEPVADRLRVVNDALEARALEIRLRRLESERREAQGAARIRAVP